MSERIGFGIYQSCMNKESVGRVSVFGMRWCGWYWGGLGDWLGPVSGRVRGWYVFVCCESGFYVYMAGPCICILCWSDTCAS